MNYLVIVFIYRFTNWFQKDTYCVKSNLISVTGVVFSGAYTIANDIYI